MGLRSSLTAGIAEQLGHPHGRWARLVAMALNRGNKSFVAAAVDALEVREGGTAADIGFGGGIGLGMLLDRVGPTGRVHGIEISTEMHERAERRFRKAIAAGRLELHQASMTQLPFGDAELDGIITVNTIYFVEDLGRAFAEIAGVLEPGGRFVLGIRDPDAMAKMPVTGHNFRVRPVSEIVDVLAERQLRLVDHRRLGSGMHAAHLLVCAPAD